MQPDAQELKMLLCRSVRRRGGGAGSSDNLVLVAGLDDHQDRIRPCREDDPLGHLIQSRGSLNKFQIIDTIIWSHTDRQSLRWPATQTSATGLNER